MIVNGVIVSNEKNKNMIGKSLKIVKKKLLDYQMLKKEMDCQMLKNMEGV